MKLTFKKLKKLIREQVESEPWERPTQPVVAQMHDRSGVQSPGGEEMMADLKGEINAAKKRWMDMYDVDAKKANFRLAADITAIERLYEELLEAETPEGEYMADRDVPEGLNTLRTLWQQVAGGKFSGDPFAAEGAGEEKAHEMAWGDESERVGHAHPPDVPAGYFGSMRESLTKSDLKKLIRHMIKEDRA
mgnify:CR=1 FL=1